MSNNLDRRMTFDDIRETLEGRQNKNLLEEDPESYIEKDRTLIEEIQSITLNK